MHLRQHWTLTIRPDQFIDVVNNNDIFLILGHTNIFVQNSITRRYTTLIITRARRVITKLFMSYSVAIKVNKSKNM